MNYILHILIMINIYLILVLSLNLLVGYTGIVSLCHSAFYGIGAYVYTLFIMKLGIHFIPAIILGIIISGVLSLAIALPSLRLRGDYFILTSLGFQIIVFYILYNWIELTRGPYGIPGIPKPTLGLPPFLRIELNSLPAYFIYTVIIVSIFFFIFYRLTKLPFCLALKSIREDELSASSLGKNTTRIKIFAFIISCSIASVSGAIYASYVTYIDPTSFTIDESIFILSLLLIGGSGNIKGPVVGTVVFIIFHEILRFLGLPDAIAANLRQMIYGLTLIILMLYRPRGILGSYKFE